LTALQQSFLFHFALKHLIQNRRRDRTCAPIIIFTSTKGIPLMRRLHANTLLLVAALIWGVTFSVQQMAMAHIGPAYFTGLRFALGALTLAPLAVWQVRRLRAQGAWRLTRLDALGLLATGCALFMGAWLQQVGIMGTTVANAGFITALYVPLTPVLALIVLRRAPHPAVWPAAAACLAGAYMMGGGALDVMRDGDLWVLGGAVFWACHILLVGAMSMRTGAPFLVSCVQFAVCGFWGLSWGGATETLSWAGVVGAWPMIAFSGLFSAAVGFTLQVVAQRHTPAADAAVILSAETLFAALAGAVLLGERLGALELAGGALIFAGVLAVELLPLWARQRARSRTSA
jgi:drug/metabolite transporter (DMT)-like permease